MKFYKQTWFWHLVAASFFFPVALAGAMNPVNSTAATFAIIGGYFACLYALWAWRLWREDRRKCKFQKLLKDDDAVRKLNPVQTVVDMMQDQLNEMDECRMEIAWLYALASFNSPSEIIVKLEWKDSTMDIEVAPVEPLECIRASITIEL